MGSDLIHEKEKPEDISSTPKDSNKTPDTSREDEKSSFPGEAHGENVIENDQTPPAFLSGWRLQSSNIGICLSLGLASLNVTIVGTSLITITNDLQGFSRSSWIITAYLLTYTGFLVILAKLSDIYGRKSLYILSIVIFVGFSIGCGLSQSMNALIVMRAFQGIGGGGINAMSFTILPEMVPTSKYPLYSAIMTSTFAIANLLGPLVGGAISDAGGHKPWRWVFLLNAPGAGLALIFIILGIPRNFPHQNARVKSTTSAFTFANLRRIDIIGTFLLLAASMLLVTAFEEGGTQFSWDSAPALAPLIISIFLFVTFAFWERHLEATETHQEGVFPWHMAIDRFTMGVMLNTFFAGATMSAVIIELPQRFQIVNGASPQRAGFQLLAVTLLTAFGSGVAGQLIQKRRIPPFYILLVSSILTTLGLALLSILPLHQKTDPATYVYEVILGSGIGLCMGASLLMIPIVVAKTDIAVAMSSFFQARELGGALAIAICTNVLNHHVRSALENELSLAQLAGTFRSLQEIAELEPALQEAVRFTYGQAFNELMKILTAFSACGVLSTFLLWEKTPGRAEKQQYGR